MDTSTLFFLFVILYLLTRIAFFLKYPPLRRFRIHLMLAGDLILLGLLVFFFYLITSQHIPPTQP